MITADRQNCANQAKHVGVMDQKPGFLLRLIGSIEIPMRYSWLAYNLYIIYSFPVSIGIGGFLNRMPPKNSLEVLEGIL